MADDIFKRNESDGTSSYKKAKSSLNLNLEFKILMARAIWNSRTFYPPRTFLPHPEVSFLRHHCVMVFRRKRRRSVKSTRPRRRRRRGVGFRRRTYAGKLRKRRKARTRKNNGVRATRSVRRAYAPNPNKCFPTKLRTRLKTPSEYLTYNAAGAAGVASTVLHLKTSDLRPGGGGQFSLPVLNSFYRDKQLNIYPAAPTIEAVDETAGVFTVEQPRFHDLFSGVYATCRIIACTVDVKIHIKPGISASVAPPVVAQPPVAQAIVAQQVTSPMRQLFADHTLYWRIVETDIDQARAYSFPGFNESVEAMSRKQGWHAIRRTGKGGGPAFFNLKKRFVMAKESKSRASAWYEDDNAERANFEVQHAGAPVAPSLKWTNMRLSNYPLQQGYSAGDAIYLGSPDAVIGLQLVVVRSGDPLGSGWADGAGSTPNLCFTLEATTMHDVEYSDRLRGVFDDGYK